MLANIRKNFFIKLLTIRKVTLLLIIPVMAISGCKFHNISDQEALAKRAGINDISSVPSGRIDAAVTESPISKEEDPDSSKQENINSDNSQDDIIGKPAEKAEDSNSADNTADALEEPAVNPAETVINNGGLYVKYQDEIYYRQYTANCYEPSAIWADYYAASGISKNMMRMKEDGTSEVAFADEGFGPIYISNNRMYLQNPGSYEVVYSVRLDGSDKKEIGKGTIQGIDEASGTIVCRLIDSDNKDHLSTVNASTGQVNQLSLTVPCVEVLAVRDGFIYYNGEVDYKASAYGQMKLCKVSVDGSEETLLAETKTDLYDFESWGTEIPCLQFVGDTIYFSYGGYAGTGGYYQGGQIASVQQDGSNFSILAGNIKDFNNPYEYLVDSDFYITNIDGRLTLYYSQSEKQSSYSLDITSGTVSSTDFIINPEGNPFEYQDGISIYQNANPELTTLIPKMDYSTLGVKKASDNYFTIHDVELCDDWVYYRLEVSVPDPEASIGWRDGYRRIKTQVIREKVGGGNKEILFGY